MAQNYGTRSGRMVAMSPPWLQGDYGGAWQAGLGDGLDTILNRIKDSVRLRMPQTAAGAGDAYALALIGEDSSLSRYPSETDSQYGDRLQRRWQTYDRAGGAARSDGSGNPILEDLVGLGFGDITIIEYRDWPANGAIPNAHNSPLPILDSLGNPWWSRFWVAIGSYNGAAIPSGAVWGSGTWGVGVWGFSLDPEALIGAVRSCLQWKPAHVLCEGLIILTDGTPVTSIWGLGTWGTSVWGGSSAFYEIHA